MNLFFFSKPKQITLKAILKKINRRNYRFDDYNDDWVWQSLLPGDEATELRAWQVLLLESNNLVKNNIILSEDIPIIEEKAQNWGRSFYKNGNVRIEVPFVNGKKEGVYKKYYESGQLSTQERYINDRAEGERIHYAPDGSIEHASNYLNGRLHGKMKIYDKGILTDERTYFYGNLCGVSKTYDSQTGKLLRETNYSNNSVMGEDKFYYNNGNVRAITEYGVFGFKISEKIFSENGFLLKQIYFCGDKLDGEYIENSNEGKPKKKYNYAFGNKHGTCIDYHLTTGNVWLEQNYVRGKRHGLVKEYNELGELIKQHSYHEGQLIGA